MTLGTLLPRRFNEYRCAVEAPGGLWHVARSAETTYCGKSCGDWPRVARAVERRGIWCGVCLITASEAQ